MFSRSRRLQHAMSRSRRALNRPWLHVDTTIDPESRAPKTATDLLIVQTYAVDGPPGTGHSHYELHFAPDDRPDAPTLEILTRNQDLYRVAAEAEGQPRRFDVTWHPSKRADGSMCRLLDVLENRTDL